MEKKNPYLLPDDVEPTFYTIWLRPDLKKRTFSGREVVRLKVNKPTNSLTFHALDLKIKSAKVSSWKNIQGGPISNSHASITKNKKFESVTLRFRNKILPSHYVTLKLEFSGVLNNKMHGFYMTSYVVGEKKYFGATTQFESTDARRCFPCWDEPAKKAKFRIILNVPADMTAISNMPVEKELYLKSDKNGRKIVCFETTPPLSTYLIAIIILHLKCLEDKASDGTPIKTWALPGQEYMGAFANECTKHDLPYYAGLFGKPYMMPKHDMVAIPDFEAGAMENPGAETFRAVEILVDPKKSSSARRQRVGEVVKHENAHMWFGDLVTMKWWNGLWLNEGFASFMGPKSMDHQFPEMDIWTQFVAQDFRTALTTDALKNSRPLEKEGWTRGEIEEFFDGIAYDKGAVVCRMLEEYLGEDFWKGLKLYFDRHQFGNATTEDLWSALENASGKPVRDIMARYTNQPGYPVVSVSIAEKGFKLYKVIVAQQRFLADGSKDRKNLKWNIPIKILYPEAGDKILIENLNKESKNVTIPGASSWIKLNPGQSGFYRVAYSDELWNALVEAVKRGEISNTDRIGLLDDSLALAKAGYMKSSQALDMLSAQEGDKEFNFSVWSIVVENLENLKHLFSGDNETKDHLARFARKLLLPALDKLGWTRDPEENHNVTLLRSLIIRNLGGYGDCGVLKKAGLLFYDALSGKDVDPNLRQSVYVLAAENGGKAELEKLLSLYESADNDEEKNRILFSLGLFKDNALIKKVLAYADSKKVRTQDWFRVMAGLGSDPEILRLTWEYLKRRWKKLVKKYGSRSLGRVLQNVVAMHLTKKYLADIKKFFGTHRLEGTERTMKQVAEIIETNIKWRDRSLEEIKSWLAKR